MKRCSTALAIREMQIKFTLFSGIYYCRILFFPFKNILQIDVAERQNRNNFVSQRAVAQYFSQKKEA